MMQKGIKYLFILMASANFWACSSGPATHEVVGTGSDVTGAFGEAMGDGEAVTIEQMYASVGTDGIFEGIVTGEIKEVCANKGCWMTLDLPDGREMRVTFKDYAFFVPKESKGYRVRIEGVAQQSVTDVATLKHYAEDAGKSREEIDLIIEPESSVSFVASGVVIEEGI
ncbi:hypothetical protein ADIS_3707 [Lunatimonas lonarensis]|uniref:DUF4920 domain-containing protein n=1 Tax=Lunatimonas lonarensis TaxID=1232681 RepID=R7ZNX1_9BACT|nr:DUF4920 domain-containing protein [Lunatimonas lonarensis]EON75816.1 hypothetical protein ADIS_3707 [Lunatimonas lonarensis]